MPGPAPQHERRRRSQGEALGRRKDIVMTMLHYSNPALDAELAYRREVLMAAGRGREPDAVPGSATAGVHADPPRRMSTASVLSEARATIDVVPRWDDAPMVGRTSELARLLAHVDRAAAGRTSTVLLAGGAGGGKRRGAARRRAHRPGHRARGPGTHRALRRPRRRRAALPAVRRPAAAGGRRPGAGPCGGGHPRPGCPAGRAAHLSAAGSTRCRGP